MITYDKDTLFKEFYIAKNKDIEIAKSKSKKSTPIDTLETSVYTNRIQFFKDHIRNKSINPKVYDNVDVNFENLLKVYESENPRDTFYLSIFNKTFAQKKLEEEIELELEYGKKDTN